MTNLTSKEILKMQIKRIEKEIRDTPHHKGTDHHLGRLRAKLSNLKEKELESGSKKGGGGGGYAVKKQGDATVVLVGPPSAGKSTLLNLLTNAKSKVAPYAFTTLTVVPGMMVFRDARIQILDVPGLIEGAEEGKGRGREVLSVVRGADLLLVMSDTDRPGALEKMEAALERNGIRINKERPKVRVEKKLKGGISVISNVKQDFDKETVKEIAKEFRFTNAEITLKEKLTIDELIDSFSKSRVYIPAIYLLNKADKDEAKNTKADIQISAKGEKNIEELKNLIFEKLNFVTVYLVKEDEEPNTNDPIIMKRGDTLKTVAKKI